MDKIANEIKRTCRNASWSKVLAFKLGGEEYGLNILTVQEVRGYDAVTRIANAPAYIKGVINLRGVIEPVLDMRIWLNLNYPTYDQFTVIIVLTIAGRTVGMVIDFVSDVITLQPELLKAAPAMGPALNTNYLVGLGIVNDRMTRLVDIDYLMSSTEVGSIDRLAA